MRTFEVWGRTFLGLNRHQPTQEGLCTSSLAGFCSSHAHFCKLAFAKSTSGVIRGAGVKEKVWLVRGLMRHLQSQLAKSLQLDRHGLPQEGSAVVIPVVLYSRATPPPPRPLASCEVFFY